MVDVDPNDLRIVLGQRTGHSHSRPGIWDPDNPPGRANMPCRECAARERLREALAADPEVAELRDRVEALERELAAALGNIDYLWRSVRAGRPIEP